MNLIKKYLNNIKIPYKPTFFLLWSQVFFYLERKKSVNLALDPSCPIPGRREMDKGRIVR